MQPKTFNCQACKERTVYTVVSFDKEGNYGDFRQCNLCNDIRPMARRKSAKRKAKAAFIDYLASL